VSKLRRKPKQQQNVDLETKYQRFTLTENPFPTSPVNKDSTDRRINGKAWSSSGLDQRYPLSPKVASPHLIPFEKLNREHVSLLIKKYLDEYRSDSFSGDELTPFTLSAINIIAEASEYNAATILRTCSVLIEKSLADDRDEIDEAFVHAEIGKREGIMSGEKSSLDDPKATDLMQKATGGR